MTSCGHIDLIDSGNGLLPGDTNGPIIGVFGVRMIHSSGIRFNMFNGGSPVNSGLHHTHPDSICPAGAPNIP